MNESSYWVEPIEPRFLWIQVGYLCASILIGCIMIIAYSWQGGRRP